MIFPEICAINTWSKVLKYSANIFYSKWDQKLNVITQNRESFIKDVTIRQEMCPSMKFSIVEVVIFSRIKKLIISNETNLFFIIKQYTVGKIFTGTVYV